MIIQPTAEQTRRVTRSRTYSGPGFGPRSFSCLGLGLGIGLGAVASGGGAPTPLTISGADILQWCRADQGVTSTTWDDISGKGQHYVQASGSAFPTFGATAGPNNTPALTFDAVDDILNCAGLNRPAPGTEATWIWMVVRQNAWTATRRLFGGVTNQNTIIAYQNTASPQITQYNAANANNVTGAAIGAWVALQFYFSNSTNDFTRVNDDAPVTGASAGNTAGSAGRSLGGANGANFCGISIAEIVIAKAVANYSAYRLARYGF